MTWNILNGGQDGQSSDRLQRIIQVVRQEDPDVLLFQEAVGFDAYGHRLLHDVENALDMRGFFGAANTGYHVATYVRRAQAVVSEHADARNFFHAMLSVELLLEEGVRLQVVNAHLCPHSSQTRLLETQHLARYAGNGKVLVAGDLNSLDPYADHSGALQQMPAHYRARYVVPGEAVTPDTRPGRTLESAGFIDVAHHCGDPGYTIPTNLPVYGSDFGRLRLDYVYVTAELAETVTGYRVISNEFADRSSDHYPILVDLQIPRPNSAEVAP